MEEYLRSQLKGLKGCTVIETGVFDESVEGDRELYVPYIVFTDANGMNIQLNVLGDAEGNHTAHIEAHRYK